MHQWSFVTVRPQLVAEREKKRSSQSKAPAVPHLHSRLRAAQLEAGWCTDRQSVSNELLQYMQPKIEKCPLYKVVSVFIIEHVGNLPFMILGFNA